MEKINFNKNWKVSLLDANDFKDISIPHDAMLTEKRVANSCGGVNSGWIDAKDYEYKKFFTLDEKYKNKILTLEFEGVYKDAEVYLNNKKVAYRPYGYTNFYVDITDDVFFDKENELVVKAYNHDQPNSRWYSGTGIYRPVNLFIQENKHILLNGVKIHTLSIDKPLIEVVVLTNSSGNVKVEILDGNNIIASEEKVSEGKITFNITLDKAKLWDVDNPNLYKCRVTFEENDEVIEEFGIRSISCTSEKGFELNNKRVIIKGACIHHDNGILGAKDYKEASYRKIRILKECGYNAIRSAHNPCSKSLLEACDHLGMMIMDEYVDMWYIHKTRYDYAIYTENYYKQDIKDMCDKDYNHPSVIMFSLGNEVAETGQKKGIEFFKLMKNECKLNDSEKPVTTGVNIFFNYLHSLGLGVYSDKKAEENPQAKVGSEFFNVLAGKFGDGFMKFMATLPGCDRKTKDCYAAMDVAGYNYGLLRYKMDKKKYPNRIILGSETFCSDAYAFYEYAKETPSLIGDFVWAGWDYLGEVGIGSWEYKEYAPDFLHGVGWVSAGSGRIDLNGNLLGEALYTKVVFEKDNRPLIAVVPVSHTKEKHSPSAWKFSNAIPSWSWDGYQGSKAKVEVYSKAPLVKLFINDVEVGKKKLGKNAKFDFNVKYQNGIIKAVSYDEKGNEIASSYLKSAEKETIISLTPEIKEAKKDEIIFINVDFTDKNGIVKPLERHDITLSLKNAKLLAFSHACPFNNEDFTSNVSSTYYGRALAVIQAIGEDDIVVNAKSLDLESEITIPLK